MREAYKIRPFAGFFLCAWTETADRGVAGEHSNGQTETLLQVRRRQRKSRRKRHEQIDDAARTDHLMSPRNEADAAGLHR